jgi:replication factor C subunit 2/4
MNESWIEKFRPKKLEDIISQEEVTSSLKNVIKTKNIPHLLFFGPSGCGKTSTILALAKELFGNEYWEDRVIELNASDERGIKIVREKIKTYAKNSVNLNKNIPPWKIIILDEADNMTADSQFALRKIMEDYCKVTRFCIICNYHHKIINPIISRCSLFRFRPIPNNLINKKLEEICKKENIFCSKENIEKIIEICSGDLRKAVNFLQKCKKNKDYFSESDITSQDKINKSIIYEISGIIPYEKINNLINFAINGNENKLKFLIDEIFNSSYSLTNQISEISNNIIKNTQLSDDIKSEVVKKIVEIDQYLIKGCDENIQYYNLFYFILNICNKK